MPRIIYIIGSGRSGTTLLDIILGNGKNCFSIGELNRFTARKGIPPSREKEDPTYSFWLEVKSSLNNQLVESLENGQLENIVNKNEYYLSPFYKLIQTKEDRYLYEFFLEHVYKEVFSRNKGEIIIESSKYPIRALNISKLLDTEISYIYLKKDPASVVRSFQKKGLEQPGKSFLMANMYYFISNAYCSYTSFLLRRRGFKVIETTFEALLSNPEKELGVIERSLGIDLRDIKVKISNNQDIPVGNLFDGNRLRLNKAIKFKRELSAYNDFKDKISRIVNKFFY